MRVAFRVDASHQMGIGHVARCLTLAEQLRRESADVCFACHELPGSMIKRIERSGIKIRTVDSLRTIELDWLIVDHYGLDYRFETPMRAIARRILVIDDLANRQHDCDLLLDQNLYKNMEDRYHGLVPEESTVLMGPRYALLRPEFAELRSEVEVKRRLGRIFIFFGGGDPTNETTKALHAIMCLSGDDIAIDVLVGPVNPHRDEIESFVRSMPRATSWAGTNRIAELMVSADLAIGGGGATSWERCCLGLPSLVIAVAGNQIDISQTLADLAYQQYLGRADEVSVESIADAITCCIERFSDISVMGRKGMSLVDGLGTDRVVAAMKSV